MWHVGVFALAGRSRPPAQLGHAESCGKVGRGRETLIVFVIFVSKHAHRSQSRVINPPGSNAVPVGGPVGKIDHVKTPEL